MDLPIEDMDIECVKLCQAINLVPGVETRESCYGHGKSPYMIWFDTEDLKHLPHLLYWFDGCHSGHYQWNVYIHTDCAKQFPIFRIEGPIGEQAYEEAEHIADLIIEDSKNWSDEEDNVGWKHEDYDELFPEFT